jgi:hypothetical protein
MTDVVTQDMWRVACGVAAVKVEAAGLRLSLSLSHTHTHQKKKRKTFFFFALSKLTRETRRYGARGVDALAPVHGAFGLSRPFFCKNGREEDHRQDWDIPCSTIMRRFSGAIDDTHFGPLVVYFSCLGKDRKAYRSMPPNSPREVRDEGPGSLQQRGDSRC